VVSQTTIYGDTFHVFRFLHCKLCISLTSFSPTTVPKPFLVFLMKTNCVPEYISTLCKLELANQNPVVRSMYFTPTHLSPLHIHFPSVFSTHSTSTQLQTVSGSKLVLMACLYRSIPFAFHQTQTQTCFYHFSPHDVMRGCSSHLQILPPNNSHDHGIITTPHHHHTRRDDAT